VRDQALRIRDRKPTESPEARAERERAIEKAIKAEATELAKFLVEDPIYLLDLQEKLRAGTLHPMLQTLLWNYAYGKPKERVEVKHAAVVKIIHEFAGSREKVIEGTVVKPEEKPDGAGA